MTWSIIARDKPSGRFGIAVATRFFAVGCRVPHIAPGFGAVATQALVNPFYGVDGLQALRDGVPATEVVAQLTAADAGRDHRQLHVVDATGGVAAHTGLSCVPWCGHRTAEDCSLAGNMLAGPGVLDATAEAYAAHASLPFPQRLIAAMQAGEAAGGDIRGKQSAALLIYGEEDWPDLDLRVDDHTEPLIELARLERVSRERFIPFSRLLPSRRDRVGVTDRNVIEAEIAKQQAADH
ncbi:MAG TPA: DUF1028 domain-containing protein [Xanthobacteraceae bacterium]|jgi:uncharacterized Ntn-hydrolase superfamily protein|nr:DUF1028 domain-containing protein [Xanthobacteraceae bacterium]